MFGMNVIPYIHLLLNWFYYPHLASMGLTSSEIRVLKDPLETVIRHVWLTSTFQKPFSLLCFL